SGFRKAHSTHTTLTFFTDLLYKQMDRGRLTTVVFLDLKKAFGTVNDDLLLSKLSQYGILNAELKWFGAYLQNRIQHTAFGSELSDPGDVMVGVTQGS
ncbi:reverse transcriptase domain-containing protein, partial [Acinetobacter baumannii]|uniref:reverse transcriptase domain-containing protein n=1 Tax=Acinetobacter baumannii TaxID=470 RepID=UPI0011774E23